VSTNIREFLFGSGRKYRETFLKGLPTPLKENLLFFWSIQMKEFTWLNLPIAKSGTSCALFVTGRVSRDWGSWFHLIDIGSDVKQIDMKQPLSELKSKYDMRCRSNLKQTIILFLNIYFKVLNLLDIYLEGLRHVVKFLFKLLQESFHQTAVINMFAGIFYWRFIEF
jgi:hypothetical protein